jgi:hypothetical protein
VTINRTPPERVKQTLREEVGFGCPIPGCREPFLTWHHFDPPWHERHHHDPDGMIALCTRHHAMADRDVFSRVQLRAFKNSPHSVEEVRAKFEWARPKQLVRLGGFYMGGKQNVMNLEVNTFKERFVGLRENDVGLLELSFVLRDKYMNRVAVMENNMFVARPDQLFDLQVDAGATKVRIREQKRKVLLDLRTYRKTPEELVRLLEADWASSQESIQKRRINDGAVGPVFRDYLLGPLTPLDINDPGSPALWRDESSGEMVDSRQHLISFVLDWAMEYCIDDEGLVPLLDFRNVLTHVFGHDVQVRDGVDVGRKRSMTFGAAFSEDSPHPSEKPGDNRPRKPFHFPSS